MKEYIKSLVEKDRLKEALGELKGLVDNIKDNDRINDLIAISARFERYNKAVILGHEPDGELNKISLSILEFTDLVLEHQNVIHPDTNASTSERNADLTTIPVILAGCGWWARERTVLPFLKQYPHLVGPIVVTNLLKERVEFNNLVLPAFEDLNIDTPEYQPNIHKAIEVLKERFPNQPIAVIINTPNKLHEELAQAALLQGCHVYTERPINRGTRETKGVEDNLEDLIKLANKNKVVLFNGVQRRLEASYKYLFNILEKKIHFNKISTITCILKTGRELKGWRTDPNLSGGGIIVDEGYHLLDAAMWCIESAHSELKIQKGNIGRINALFKYGEMNDTDSVETTAMGNIEFKALNILMNFNFT